MDILKGMDNIQENSVKWARCLNGLTFRVMLPWSAKGQIWKEVHSHRIEMPMGKFTRYEWICTQKTSGTSCRICDVLTQLRSQGYNVDLSTSRSYYVNAIITNDPSGTYQAGDLVVLRLPFQGVKTIQEFILNPMIGNFLGLGDNGADLICKKEGQGILTKYSFNISPNGRKALPGYESLSLYDLDDVLKGESEDDLNQLLSYIGANPVVAMSEKAVENQTIVAAPTPQTASTQQVTPQVEPGVAHVPPAQPSIFPPTTPSENPQPVPPVVSQPVAQQSSTGKPPCFGQYKPGEINCILCQHEVLCKSVD